MSPSSETSLFEILIRALGRGFLRAWQSAPVASTSAPVASTSAPVRRPRKRRAPPPVPAERRQVEPPVPVRPKAGHEVVRYRQGKGSFEARIVSFDKEARLLTLERLSDGKRVQRPASKVYAA